METLLIEKKNQQLTTNFNMLEFYNGSKPKQNFYIAKPLIEGSQILRDFFDAPFKITSTYRPTDTFGFHRVGLAVDLVPLFLDCKFQTVDLRKLLFEEFKRECLLYVENPGMGLLYKLRKIGIAGFGIEKECIHLDCRNSGFSRFDKFGKYTIFEFSYHYGANMQMIVDVNRSI